MDVTSNILTRAGLVLSGPSSCPSVSVVCSSSAPVKNSGSHVPSASPLSSGSAVKSFHCGKCGKSFTENKRRNQHEKDCGGVDCTICSKHFTTRRALKEHTNAAHSMNFRCVICRKCFGGVSKLNRHMPSHDEEKRVECEECGQIFKRKDNLTRHMKTHN